MNARIEAEFQGQRWLAGALLAVAWVTAAVSGGTAAAAAAPATTASAGGSGAASDWSARDRISYSVGAQTGRALRTADGAEVNLETLITGLKDGLAGEKLAIPEKQMQALLQGFQQTLRQKMAATRGRAIAANREQAEKFFSNNRGAPGIVSLASGVQYRILKSGAGTRPAESDVVTVNYRGTLLSGTEFDSTEPGHPAHFKLAALIAGWKEALKLMPVGSHWQLYIPPQLAYGERGVGAEIGPNEALIFDVELLATQPAEEDG